MLKGLLKAIQQRVEETSEVDTRPTYDQIRAYQNIHYLMVVRTPGGKKLHTGSMPYDRTYVSLDCGSRAHEYELVDVAQADSYDVTKAWALESYGSELCGNCKKWLYPN